MLQYPHGSQNYGTLGFYGDAHCVYLTWSLVAWWCHTVLSLWWPVIWLIWNKHCQCSTVIFLICYYPYCVSCMIMFPVSALWSLPVHEGHPDLMYDQVQVGGVKGGPRMRVLWLGGLGPLVPMLLPGVVWALGHGRLPIWLPPVGVGLPGLRSLGGSHGARGCCCRCRGGPGGIGRVHAPLVIVVVVLLVLVLGPAPPVIAASSGVVVLRGLRGVSWWGWA